MARKFMPVAGGGAVPGSRLVRRADLGHPARLVHRRRRNAACATTSACAANVPPTTALRWLRILEAGLVSEDDGRDGRRTFVCLDGARPGGDDRPDAQLAGWRDQWRRPRRQEMLPSHHARKPAMPLTSSWTERLTEKSGALAKRPVAFAAGLRRESNRQAG
jgi:hypothetical protein